MKKIYLDSNILLSLDRFNFDLFLKLDCSKFKIIITSHVLREIKYLNNNCQEIILKYNKLIFFQDSEDFKYFDHFVLSEKFEDDNYVLTMDKKLLYLLYKKGICAIHITRNSDLKIFKGGLLSATELL